MTNYEWECYFALEGWSKFEHVCNLRPWERIVMWYDSESHWSNFNGPTGPTGTAIIINEKMYRGFTFTEMILKMEGFYDK